MNSENLFSDYEQKKPTKKTGPGINQKRGRKSLKDYKASPSIIHHAENIPLEKQYYSISEVSEIFEVNASLIRFWEKEFSVLQPKKNKKGDRLFRKEDIEHLRVIYYLLRERKYTIEGAKQKLKEDKLLTVKNFEIVQSLQKIRNFLVTLKGNL